MSERRDERWMARALDLAERGGGATAPNPMVGCVLVGERDVVLGEGFHARAGGPHAEVAAIENARSLGNDIRGAEAYVTLEPCAHEGRTRPCATALIDAGIQRVVFATVDPHVGAGGRSRMEAAGVDVVGGVLEARSRALNEPWFHFIARDRPFWHIKTAQTLSAHVGRGPEGERWVTGEGARAVVHRMRRAHRAVLVGIGTVLADDPRLTARWPGPSSADPPWPEVQPVRVVLDRRLRMPLDGTLMGTVDEGPIVVFGGVGASRDAERKLEDAGARVVRVPETGTGLSLPAVSDALYTRDVTGVLVEPGPTLAGALVGAGLADRWTVFVAPDWVADTRSPRAWTADIPCRLDRPRWSVHGSDMAVTGTPRIAGEPTGD